MSDIIEDFKNAMAQAINEATAGVVKTIVGSPDNATAEAIGFVTSHSVSPLPKEHEGTAMFFLAVFLSFGILYFIFGLIKYRENIGTMMIVWSTHLFTDTRVFGLALMGVGPEFYLFCSVVSLGLAGIIVSMTVFGFGEILTLTTLGIPMMIISFKPATVALIAAICYCFVWIAGLLLVRTGGAFLLFLPNSRIVQWITKMYFLNITYPMYVATLILLMNMVSHCFPLPALLETALIPLVLGFAGYGYFLGMILVYFVRSTNIQANIIRIEHHIKKGATFATGGVVLAAGGAPLVALGATVSADKLLQTDKPADKAVQEKLELRQKKL